MCSWLTLKPSYGSVMQMVTMTACHAVYAGSSPVGVASQLRVICKTPCSTMSSNDLGLKQGQLVGWF